MSGARSKRRMVWKGMAGILIYTNDIDAAAKGQKKHRER